LVAAAVYGQPPDPPPTAALLAALRTAGRRFDLAAATPATFTQPALTPAAVTSAAPTAEQPEDAGGDASG
jgi:hypothetical protein